MRISWATCANLVAGVLVASSLGGCGNLSHRVAADGSGAEQLVWPTPDQVVSIHKGGTFPTVESVRQIGPGMGKSQIIDVLGAPHFNEGAWGVREWNYVFNFREPGSDRVSVCQYKVLFDDKELARSFYWKPESCAALVQAQKVADSQVFTLSGDALFGFDKDAVEDLPNGREQLDALAQKILARRDDVTAIRILGYTDRLGSDSYNDGLSERRAYAVMRFLVERGVPDRLVTAAGLGKADPVQTGCTDEAHEALVACLAPNRRVEVRVFGGGQDPSAQVAQ